LQGTARRRGGTCHKGGRGARIGVAADDPKL
jgi:hypothetical protein